MAKVILHGFMAEKYGHEFEIMAGTGSECIRAMISQLGGFQRDIVENSFSVRICDRDVFGKSEQEATENVFKAVSGPVTNSDEIHVIPAIGGSGSNGGIFMIVAGAVLIGAAFFTGGATLSAWGALQVGLAVGGASMVLGGLATVMTKIPSAQAPRQAKTGNSTSFSSVDNIAGQGEAIPLLYGRCLIGSKVVSQQIETLTKGI